MVIQNLRSSIIWASTACLEKMAISHDIAQSKICYLHISSRIQEKVLRLEVPMNNHIPMAILNTRNNLLQTNKHDEMILHTFHIVSYSTNKINIMILVIHILRRANRFLIFHPYNSYKPLYLLKEMASLILL